MWHCLFNLIAIRHFLVNNGTKHQENLTSHTKVTTINVPYLLPSAHISHQLPRFLCLLLRQCHHCQLPSASSYLAANTSWTGRLPGVSRRKHLSELLPSWYRAFGLFWPLSCGRYGFISSHASQLCYPKTRISTTWRSIVRRHPQHYLLRILSLTDFYICGMSILCSICVFPRGNIKYIDALFFGSGASTQSGLNTVDLNLLDTWQQVSNAISAKTLEVGLRDFSIPSSMD